MRRQYKCPADCGPSTADSWTCVSSEEKATVVLKTRQDGTFYYMAGPNSKLYMCQKNEGNWYCDNVPMTYSGIDVVDSYDTAQCETTVPVIEPDPPAPVIDPTTDPCECDEDSKCIIC